VSYVTIRDHFRGQIQGITGLKKDMLDSFLGPETDKWSKVWNP